MSDFTFSLPTPHMPDTILLDPDGKEWIVGAVGMTGGERYYWLVDEDDSVSMMPAPAVEDWPVKALRAQHPHEGEGR